VTYQEAKDFEKYDLTHKDEFKRRWAVAYDFDLGPDFPPYPKEEMLPLKYSKLNTEFGKGYGSLKNILKKL